MKKTKEEIRQEIIKFSENVKHLLITNATGTGKSYASLSVMMNKNTSKKCLIVVKETLHIDNWKKEFLAFNLDMSNFEFICYQSLHKYTNTDYNLILDEVHALSEKRLEYIKTIKYDYLISLSATLNKKIKYRLNSIYEFKEYHLSLKEAIELEILPTPKIFVCKYNLEEKIKDNIYEITVGKGKIKKEITCDYDERFKIMSINKHNKPYKLNIRCSEREYYSLLSSSIEYFKDKGKTFKSTASMLTYKRKRFISSLKTSKIQQIVNKLQDKRYICFTSSIDQCDKIAIGNNKIHSKTPKKDHDKLINAFNNYEINNLTVVDMLKESINLVDCKYGILSQLDSFELSFIQRLGRILRTDDPVLFVIVAENTIDEIYFEAAYKSLNPENIKMLKDSWLE